MTGSPKEDTGGGGGGGSQDPFHPDESRRLSKMHPSDTYSSLLSKEDLSKQRCRDPP